MAFCFAFSALLAPNNVMAGDFAFDWDAVTWPAESIGPNTYTLTDENGFEVDVRVGIARFGGAAYPNYPAVVTGFGTASSLGIAYDSNNGNSGVGESTNTMTLEILSGGAPLPADGITLEISDIDSVDNNGTTDRCDFVTVTGNNGDPSLAYKLPGNPNNSVRIGVATGSGSTGTLAANQAQCIYNIGTTGSNGSDADDFGTIIASYPAPTHTATVLYDESIENVYGVNSRNAAARGIGVFANTLVTFDNEISLQKTANKDSFGVVGEVITYTFTIKNDSAMPLNTNQDIIVQDDKIGTINCATLTAPIPPAGTVSCSADYLVTAADLAAGSVTNIATAGVGLVGQSFGARLQSDPVSLTVANPDRSDAADYAEAQHELVSGLFLGAAIDVEGLSIANSDASGDGADDDGVSSFAPLTVDYSNYAVDAVVTNTTGSAATLHGWIDLDRDNVFEAGEHTSVSVPDGTNSGSVSLSWSSLPGISEGDSFVRLRLTTDTLAATDAATPATDGEVEDYALSIWTDADAFSSLPQQCGGWNHLGWVTYGEPGLHDSQVQFNSGDPANDPYEYIKIVRDNDGRIVSHFGTPGESVSGSIPALPGSELATTAKDDPGHQSEYHASVYRIEGTPGSSETITYDTVGGYEHSAYWLENSAGTVLSSADFRLTSVDGIGSEGFDVPVTYPSDGVLYLYFGVFDPTAAYGKPRLPGYACPFDFDDAPTGYGSASHALSYDFGGPNPDLYLGSALDYETSGFNGATSLGDDNDGTDDEDGVTIGAVGIGQTGSAEVAVTGSGLLSAWIDFDGSGAFDSPVEQIADDIADVDGNGLITVNFTVPSWATSSATVARFRWSSDPSIAATGEAPDGEVEDYAVTFGQAGTSLSGRIFVDNGAGGGTAHDGLIGGTETAGQFGTVAILAHADGSFLANASVDGAGNWTATLPTSFSGEARIVMTPASNYIPVSEATGTLPAPTNPSTEDAQIVASVASASSYSGIDFGVIAPPTFTQDQSASIQAGQIVSLAHRYEATTAGLLVIELVDEVSSAANGFQTALFRDTDCDGTGDTPLSSPISVVAGDSICLVARTQAASGLGVGSNLTYGITASTGFNGIAAVSRLRNDDRLGSAGERLELTKLVRNLTSGSDEGVSNTGAPGDVLEYRLVLTNESAGPANYVTVSDMTPAWTELSESITSPVTVISGVDCTVITPNSAGYVGPIEWDCPGIFPAGASGELRFRVTIQ